MDKRQLIRNADDILESLNPAKVQELQDNDPSITNLKRSRKTSVKADEKNILRYAVDIAGKTIQAILLPKALRPWIIASMNFQVTRVIRDHITRSEECSSETA